MTDRDISDICKRVSELTVLSFRKLDDVKKLARHFQKLLNDPSIQNQTRIMSYLKSMDQMNKNIFLQKRDGVEVEYILSTEKKSSLQRQRFNSLPISEVPELIKTEFLAAENAKQVHICTDCDVEIELNDDVPLMESLQKHFNLEVHQPKLKRESIDVAEPIVLPKMSRRLSAAMASGENTGQYDQQGFEQIINIIRNIECLDKKFLAKLEASLVRNLPDNSEANIDAAVKFYQKSYDQLCQEITSIDFTTQTQSVAPIIMSIKDNVNQNFATDANKNFENDDNEQTPEKPAKNQIKKYRYYGPIESVILNFLGTHKIISLVDDRTRKLAFFCMVCEYYTLRFRYDSVLNHVFSETHIHNLSCVLQADKNIPFAGSACTVEKIKEINDNFLIINNGVNPDNGYSCNLCKTQIDSKDVLVMHLLDENHLGRLSDRMYRKMKATNPDGQIPEEWGPRTLDWTKYLGSVGKPNNNRDHVIMENFIKASGKIVNYCSCCDMTLKGPRQVLFNHIRQKKHLRNAAPHKLSLLYKNYCRPAEYFASFGNYYVCALCPTHIALPSFGAIIEHFESDLHIETIAKLITSALHPEPDRKLMNLNRIIVSDVMKCEICDVTFKDMVETVMHVLSSTKHQNAIVDLRTRENKGDVISIYMRGNYILNSEGATFTCVTCKGAFNSIRSLLMHLMFSEHFATKPLAEDVFRFYLELKHNINMLSRNKYVYYDFGKLKCGVCDMDVEEGENAKRHVVSPTHRENMGASYVINLDTSAAE
ncbi:uncharacterized protein LOC121736429 [Aricia agestis]|uniref:uncharacterized protein LOC121736429 n=1 Tax=Aricia agestis TaxID=91739 RepID=UPI001C2085F8|nr:uncharacterized protein LOC121736429 [Aricia agestis]